MRTAEKGNRPKIRSISGVFYRVFLWVQLAVMLLKMTADIWKEEKRKWR